MKLIFFRTILSFLLDKGYRDLLITTAIVLGIGTTTYHYIEGWRWIDAIYFSVATLSTVGYGDFYPKTDLGKIFTIFYIIIGIGIILTFINTLYFHYSSNLKKHRSNE
ncbi:MAG: potassium channel family protein [Flavobacteriales bacterium]